MKSRSGAFALLLPLTLAGAGNALAADAGAATCSEATLRGTYLFAHEGFTVSGTGRGPFAIAGQDVFDGHGNQRGVITVSANGKITRFIHDAGKYTVNPDCIGSIHFSGGRPAICSSRRTAASSCLSRPIPGA
jgi:hypothetical protein